MMLNTPSVTPSVGPARVRPDFHREGHDAPVSCQVLKGQRQVDDTTAIAAKRIPYPAQSQPVPDSEARIRDWLGRPLPVNYYANGRSPLEGLVPLPRHTLTRACREEDLWLRDTCKQSGYLEAFNALLEERQAREARHEDFCLAPLKTTLRNMQTFIGHIRSGQQFDGPLTDKEDQAMAWALEKARAFEKAGAPYKKTVYLALAFLVLYEIITDRQVLDPLAQQRPDARERLQLDRVTDWSSRLGLLEPREEDDELLSAALLDPVKVTQLCWGGINPDAESETAVLFGQIYTDDLRDLAARVDDPDLLIYPSFQELDIEDFCRLSHLPLHPVGMTTDYAQGADGIMESPLAFAFHDLDHMRTLADIGNRQLQARGEIQYLLTHCDSRLSWRCLLLDRLPARLAPLRLEPALTLLLFQLFHENMPLAAVTYGLDAGRRAFVWCLDTLAQARRGDRNGYTARYQSVTDAQALLATGWCLRLWALWKKEGQGPLSDRLLDGCARQFVDQDVPRLRQHLGFVRDHWASLRQFFSGPDYAALCFGKNGRVCVRLKSSRLFAGQGGHLLFESWNPFSGLCHLDYTDVTWFTALLSPMMCRQLARRFPAMPEPDFFPPDSPGGQDAVIQI